MAKKRRSVSKLLFAAIVVIVILMIFLNQQKEKTEEGVEEEDVGSGFLEVETFPANAEIYVDGILRGTSPDTIYNIQAGIRNIVIKKDGYNEYREDVSIEAGKKAFIEADLTEKIAEGPKAAEPEGIVEEPEPVRDIGETEGKIVEEPIDSESENIVNIGAKLQFYYDFSEEVFSDVRDASSDIFSRRFDTYLVFTRFSPVKIEAINRKIDNLNKEDCANAAGTFEYLYSGKSLCIITKEGQIAAIGGYWENTENAELIWKVFD